MGRESIGCDLESDEDACRFRSFKKIGQAGPAAVNRFCAFIVKAIWAVVTEDGPKHCLHLDVAGLLLDAHCVKEWLVRYPCLGQGRGPSAERGLLPEGGCRQNEPASTDVRTCVSRSCLTALWSVLLLKTR